MATPFVELQGAGMVEVTRITLIGSSTEGRSRIECRFMTTTLTCFKYRSPAAALRCLAEGSLYFAKPSELNDTLEAKYEHATPEDFARVMTQAYSGISQQRGSQGLKFDQRGMAEMAEAHARECKRLEAFTEQIGIFSASRAVSVKHTDWSHEKEIRLLAPKSGALPVLGEVLKRVHFVRTDGEHWGAIMQLLRADYPTVETMHWQFSHGELSAIPTPMELRLIPM